MTGEIANVDMAAAWDGDEGDDWADEWEHHDRAVHEHHLVLLDGAGIGAADRVLDVGCGNGRVTRDAARTSLDGSVLGVDLSSRMLERARALARKEGLGNCEFEQADAQVFPFDRRAFDVVISRMGTMFFGDPVAAFANVGAALRPAGRLAMIVWRGRGDNEWLDSVLTALAIGREVAGPPADAPGPLGLADPDATRTKLHTAGFERIELDAVEPRFWMGADGEAAYEFFRRSGIVRGMTQGLEPVDRDRALDALHATLMEHDTGEGVYFESGCWLVTAAWPA